MSSKKLIEIKLKNCKIGKKKEKKLKFVMNDEKNENENKKWKKLENLIFL